jgi:hypothetical protein
VGAILDVTRIFICAITAQVADRIDSGVSIVSGACVGNNIYRRAQSSSSSTVIASGLRALALWTGERLCLLHRSVESFEGMHVGVVSCQQTGIKVE